MFARHRPQVVMLAAAQVGGIVATRVFRAISSIATDDLRVRHRRRVEERLREVRLSRSSCIYPKAAEIPIREEAFFSGPLELTNEWYAVAKIAGIKLGQAYASSTVST